MTPTLHPRRPYRARLVAAVIATVLVASASLAVAPPAHAALSTAFTVHNLTVDPLTLLGSKGHFPTPPGTSIPAKSSSRWDVEFWLGQNNWADLQYKVSGTPYQVWLSANPAYGPAYPAIARCTIRDDQGRIVNPPTLGCVIDGTKIIVGTPVDATLDSRLRYKLDSVQEGVWAPYTGMQGPTTVAVSSTATLRYILGWPGAIEYRTVWGDRFTFGVSANGERWATSSNKQYPAGGDPRYPAYWIKD